MKNNKLTLKALKEELENLKKSKTSMKVTPSSIKRTTDTNSNSNNSEVAGHDIKGYYINRIYMKGSMFWLYIITGVLSYAHKLPYIRKLISLLALWYGRTTWWKILIKIRRIFIMINAMIGLMIVIKTTGFSTDNIFAGISAMGYTYLELLFNFTKRLFNWFVELFDHKIVPNVPGTPSSPTNHIRWPVNTPSSTEGQRLLSEKWLNEIRNKVSLQDFLQNPFNVNISTPSPWYKEWSTYFWIIGIVSVAFIGYKFIIDPLFIENLPSYPSGPKGKGIDIPSPDTPTQTNFIPQPPKNMFSLLSWAAWKAGSSTLTGIKMLNPLYWIPLSTDTTAAIERFMDNQISENYDNRFYPFTEVNPFDPWYTKLRIHLLGETNFELTSRNLFKKDILVKLIPSESPRIITSLPTTPTIGHIGLGLGVNSGDAIDASTSYFRTLTKISSAPSTSKLTPINLPVESLEGGMNSWNLHTKLNNIVSTVESVTENTASNSSVPHQNVVTDNLTTPKAKVLELTPTKNKYSVLEEELI
jgi:hypothetical protein